MEQLSRQELVALVKRVFAVRATDRRLAMLVDLPDERSPDTSDWKNRRQMAQQWAKDLHDASEQTGLDVSLCLYANVGMTNAQLPDYAWVIDGKDLLDRRMPGDASELPRELTTFDEVFGGHSVIVAPTQYSATAPLKLLAKKYGLRAATMPGFSEQMIPALRIDYGEVNRRVTILKELLDAAASARFVFEVEGMGDKMLTLDLRYRTGHASGGLVREPGTAGNLPSGEAYIVPYEGEREGEPSQSNGELPVQLGSDVVLYEVRHNRAVRVLNEGDHATAKSEQQLLVREPAYGNLAELGLGVLSDFSIKPVGEVLLDEKLGLHIAFGRSDHFGGQVGPKQFTSPQAVVHIDRVYVPSLQPRVKVRRIDLVGDDGRDTALMRDGEYAISFG